jgi:hypothetical protein
MRLPRNAGLLPLVMVLVATACGDEQPLMPLTPEPTLSAEDVIALEVLTSPVALDAALALAAGPVAAADRRGLASRMRGAAAGDVAEARARFQEAARLRVQDPTAAAEQSREARRRVAGAAQAMVGGRMAVAMVERIEGLSAEVSENPGAYHDAAGLLQELMGLATQARLRLSQGDSTGAAERGVLAEQRTRQRQRDGDSETRAGGAVVSVALASSSVALASRLLDEGGADEEQVRYLDTAVEYLRLAEAALEAGDPGRAVHYAKLSEWTALKAVVLPGGVTDEEARAMLDLAESLYGQAAATGLDDTEAALLERARALIAHGSAALEGGSVRGVVALWRAAVICTWIIG